MTVEEAQAIIKRKSSIPMENETFEYISEAYDMAIEAFDELHAYRAIGTVEEFKAIKQWKSDIIKSFSKYDVNSVDELMKRFRELTEKAEPKKPIIDDSGHEVYKLCPTCRAHLIGTICCGRCGQRIG